MSELQSRIHPPPPLRRSDTDRERAVLITHLVAYATGVPALEIAGRGRRRPQAGEARALAMYLAHTALGWPLARVGAAFERDRTTVAHGCRRIEDRRDEPAFDAMACDLEACLRAAPARDGDRA